MFSTRVWTSVAVCTIAALGQVAPGMALPVGGAEGQAAPGFVYETNQDLWGNDIPPMLTAASASECADKCVGIASCTAFTFHVSQRDRCRLHLRARVCSHAAHGGLLPCACRRCVRGRAKVACRTLTNATTVCAGIADAVHHRRCSDMGRLLPQIQRR